MTTTTLCNLSRHVAVPCLNRVEASRPFLWLRLGWGDFLKVWPTSLLYGLILAGASFLLAVGGVSRPALMPTLTVTLLLLGPFLAIGLYDLSLRLERERDTGQRPGAFSTAGDNLLSIGLFGALLAFAASVWERLSAILIGMQVGAEPVIGEAWLFSLDQPGFLIAYGLFVLLFGLAVFSLSVVALPMLMASRIDVVTAIMTSLWATRVNPAALLAWAACIAVLTVLAVVPAFAGLAVVFPVLGHASWHAYRDLVAVDGAPH